jgi:ketosteroid isomerase-like protein
LVTHGRYGFADLVTFHPDSVALTRDADQHPHVFARAFNSGDPDAVEAVYEPTGVLVPTPGEPVTGTERREANQRLMDLGLPIEVRPRHVYVHGDLALLIVDWTISGTGQDGEPVHVEGTATDVARRGPDGFWRYAIDNPLGTT